MNRLGLCRVANKPGEKCSVFFIVHPIKPLLKHHSPVDSELSGVVNYKCDVTYAMHSSLERLLSFLHFSPLL